MIGAAGHTELSTEERNFQDNVKAEASGQQEWIQLQACFQPQSWIHAGVYPDPSTVLLHAKNKAFKLQTSNFKEMQCKYVQP